MSLSGDKGVAQFKKSVKMGHPTVQHTMISVTVSALHNLDIHILLDCAKTHLTVVFFSIILD